MADRFKKVQAGQPLHVSAEVWNAFLDSVRERKGRNHDQLTDVLDQFRQGDIVKLRNNSGHDCSRFNVLAINTPITTPSANEREFKNRVAISGVRPLHPTHFSRFGILLDPVRHGKIGRAWISGVCPAFITVTDNCHQFADVKHNDSGSLESRPFGSAQILWREGGLGEQWAIVRLSNANEDFRRFRLITTLVKCGTAQAQRIVYSEPLPGIPNWCNVDCLFQVYDSLGIVDASQPAQPGISGWAKWLPDSQKWEVVQIGDGCCQGSSSSGSSSSWSSWSSSYGSSSSSWSSSSSGSSSGSSSESSGSSSSSVSSSDSSSSSSSSSGSSGSSSSGPESCVTIYETDVRCEGGHLNVYRRAVSICLEGGSLHRYEGAWVYWHGAGCCKCDGDSSSSSGSSSGSSSWSSSSSSSSGSASSSSASGSSSSSSIPVCTGGRVWNGSECVCPPGTVWNELTATCVAVLD